MIVRALLLGVMLVWSAHGTVLSEINDQHDNPFASAGWTFRSYPDLDVAESQNERESDADKEREPLSPDWTDPSQRTAEVKPQAQPRPKPAGFDPEVIPGGVIDVNADPFGGIPNIFRNSFPGRPDDFGLPTSFGDRFGGVFGIGGLFGPERKPWWKGDNVCVEREETTDDDDDVEEVGAGAKNRSKTPKFFSTAISLSNCQQTPNKYECTTKINNHGVVKTFVVRYKCCYGFKRADNSPGCSRQVDLKPLLETIEAIDGQEFKKLVLSAGLDNRLSDENLTVFLPTNDALISFSQQMEDINQVDLKVAPLRRRRQDNPIPTQELLLNHIVPGFLDTADFTNNEILKSTNNHPVRINIYPSFNYGKMVTANCVRVRKGDNLATNGVVHVLDGVLAPVTNSVQDIIAQHPQLGSFRRLLENSDLAKNFKDNGTYTVFAPTEAAFHKLDEATRQKLLRGDSCGASVFKHHVVNHVICSSAVASSASSENVAGDVIRLKRTDDDKLSFESDATVVKPDIVGTNGVVHLIDTVVIPEAAQYINQALKSENFTKFLNLIDEAGLREEIDGLQNATVLAPSDKAFEDPESAKFLESIKGDKDKTRELVRYHTVQGQMPSCDMNNNQMLTSKNTGQKIRLNLYSTLPIFTNIINRATVNCAPLTGYDEKACGSVVHEVGKILQPPSSNVLDLIRSDESLSVLSELIQGTEVEEVLKDENQSITFLAPTNAALQEIDDADLKVLKEDKKKASALLKNHVLTEVLCCSGVGPQTFGFSTLVPTLLPHQQQAIGRAGEKIRIGDVTVTSCDKVATNGVVHKVNGVLFPQQPRHLGFGNLFLFDI